MPHCQPTSKPLGGHCSPSRKFREDRKKTRLFVRKLLNLLKTLKLGKSQDSNPTSPHVYALIELATLTLSNPWKNQGPLGEVPERAWENKLADWFPFITQACRLKFTDEEWLCLAHSVKYVSPGVCETQWTEIWPLSLKLWNSGSMIWQADLVSFKVECIGVGVNSQILSAERKCECFP